MKVSVQLIVLGAATAAAAACTWWAYTKTATEPACANRWGYVERAGICETDPAAELTVWLALITSIVAASFAVAAVWARQAHLAGRDSS